MPALRFDVISIFPEVFEPVFRSGVVGRAIRDGVVELQAHDLRRYAADPRQVDDAPFGGGPGMVMKPEPLSAALEAVRAQNSGPVVLMEPWGEPLDQAMAAGLAREPGLVVVCGRYEGIDDRVRQVLADRERSIGDYAMSGGESPALVLIDAVARLVPGVVGDEASLAQDSFATAEAAG